jgi:phage shock protein PspC (stress-responsive transcriptional regulator)
MTWEYLHLVAHSFPIVLSITGVCIGFAGWSLHRPDLERWALVALVVAGVFVIPAYITGIVAADVVGERIFVRPGIVQSHRLAATWAAIPIVTAGVLAGFALYEHEDRRLRRFVIVVGLIAAAVIGYAAFLGSKIRHPNEPDEATEPAAGERVSAMRTGWTGGSRGRDRCASVITRGSRYATPITAAPITTALLESGPIISSSVAVWPHSSSWARRAS